jgi:hypothetical protein
VVVSHPANLARPAVATLTRKTRARTLCLASRPPRLDANATPYLPERLRQEVPRPRALPFPS